MKENTSDSPLDPDDEVDLGLGRDVEVTSLPGLPLQPDLLPLLVSVLLDVLVGTLEDDLSLGLSLLLVVVMRRGSSKDNRKTEIDRVSLPYSQSSSSSTTPRRNTATHHPHHLPTRFFSKTVSPERWLTITGIIVVLPFYQVHDRLADPRLKSVGPIFCIILFLSRLSLFSRLRGLIAVVVMRFARRTEMGRAMGEGGGCPWQPKCREGKPGRAACEISP